MKFVIVEIRFLILIATNTASTPITIAISMKIAKSPPSEATTDGHAQNAKTEYEEG